MHLDLTLLNALQPLFSTAAHVSYVRAAAPLSRWMVGAVVTLHGVACVLALTMIGLLANRGTDVIWAPVLSLVSMGFLITSIVFEKVKQS